MKKYLVGVVVLLMAVPVLANSLGLPNELANGNFDTGDFAPWAKTGGATIYNYGDWGVAPGPNATEPKWAGVVTSYGGDWVNPSGMIRQVVDESQFPGWDPTMNQKEIDLEFDRVLAAVSDDPGRTVGIRVFLDYMEDGSFPDPFETGYVRQMVYEEWLVPTINGYPGPGHWAHQQIHLTLPTQPRYLSVEVEFHAHFAQWSFVGIDNLDLEARCIPEPATLGLLLLGGLPLVRRRRVY